MTARRFDIRWGDVQVQTIPTGAGTPLQSPIQLVKSTSLDSPETWTVFLCAQYLGGPNFPALPGLIVNVVYSITVGTGSSAVTFPFTFVFNPVSTTPVEDFSQLDTGGRIVGYHRIEMPAKDIQISGQWVQGSKFGVSTQSWEIGAWAAPRIPFALPPDAGHHGWMPPGFTPEPMGYR